MINENMTIGELIRVKPDTIETLMSFGMGCVGCPSAQAETLAEAAQVHGIDIEKLMMEINK